MKESFSKIQAWIKSHPWLALGIGVVVVVIGYFVVKSSGGNPSGSSIDGGSLGSDELSDPMAGLAGLGSGAAAMPAVTSGGESAPSLVSELPSLDGGGDLGSFDMGIASGFDPYIAPMPGLISDPISNESLVSTGKKSSMAAAIARPNPGNTVKTAVTTPAKTATTTPIKLGKTLTESIRNISPVKTPAPVTTKKVTSIQKIVNVISPPKSIGKGVGGGARGAGLGQSKTTAPPNLFKFSGVYPGWRWVINRYVRI